MKKKLNYSILLIIVILFSLLWTGSVQAESEGDFTDTFDDNSLQGWDHSQNVLVEDGALRIDPDNFAFKMGSWNQPDISFKVQLSSPGGLLLHYHMSDRGVFRLVLVYEGDRPELMLEVEQDGETEQLGNSFLEDFKENDWNTLSVVYQDDKHTVSFNNNSVFEVSDISNLPGGGIGFATFGENPVLIDDLTVTAVSGVLEGVTPPEEGEPMPEGEVPPIEEGELPPASMQTTPLVTPQSGTGTRSLLEELFTAGANPLDLQTFAINLGLSVILAYILSLVYIHWGASLSNRRKFASNFMLITITTTFIILVVRSSVALSLGLVGALSIVRFRAAIKEPEELAFLFLAIGLGIGLGDNQRLITILALVAAILVLGLMRLFRRSQSDVNMHLNIATAPGAGLTLEAVMNALQPYCAKLKLLRFDENKNGMELSFLVELHEVDKLNQVRASLQSLTPDVSITFLDNKGVW